MSFFGFADDIHVIEYELAFSHDNELKMGRGWYLVETPSERKSQFFRTKDIALLALEEEYVMFN